MLRDATVKMEATAITKLELANVYLDGLDSFAVYPAKMDFSVSIAASVVNVKMAVFADRTMVFVNALLVGLAHIAVKFVPRDTTVISVCLLAPVEIISSAMP